MIESALTNFPTAMHWLVLILTTVPQRVGLGRILDLEWTSQDIATVTALATIAIAFSALVTVCLTAATVYLTRKLAKENRLMRQAGTEPMVVPYLSIDRRFSRVVNFALMNVGQGPARNVRYKFEADADDFAEHKVALLNFSNRTAISMLPQGERIEEFFGMGPLLLTPDPLKPFQVSIKFDDLHGRSQGWTSHSLDIAQFRDFGWLGSPPEIDIRDSLRKIEGHLAALTKGVRR